MLQGESVARQIFNVSVILFTSPGYRTFYNFAFQQIFSGNY